MRKLAVIALAMLTSTLTISQSPTTMGPIAPKTVTIPGAVSGSYVKADGTGAGTPSGTLPGSTGSVGTVSGAGVNFGARYAYLWQTPFPTGNNGIANASSGATGQTVIADPSYATTEQPSSTFFSVNQFHYQDLRNGGQVDFYHNPSVSLFPWPYFPNGGNYPEQHAAVFDGLGYGSSAGRGGTYAGTGVTQIEYASYTPGWNFGNPPISNAAAGWYTTSTFSINTWSNSEGITESLTINQYKPAVGDNFVAYYYNNYAHGGQVDTSGQGTGGLAINVAEDNYTYTGTIVSGGATGATSLKTLAVTDSGLQGVGQPFIDTTNSPITGQYTNIGTGLGNISAAITVANVSGGSITASQAWGTLNGDCATPANTTTPPFSTSMSCSITVTHGTFTASSSIPYCFAGNFHETAFATNVTGGGTVSVTIPLRNPHATGTEVMQGGMCGNGFEATQFTESPAGQPLRYLFDVIGSTDTHTLEVNYWLHGSPGTIPIPVNSWQTTPVGIGVTNGGSGTTVTFQTGYAVNIYNGSTILFAGLSDSALNTTCTNMQLIVSTSTGTCTIAGLSGSHTDTTGGTLQLAGTNSFKLWPMAEILDVQCETCSPPALIDGSGDNTFLLEPNILHTANGHTIESPHHATLEIGVQQNFVFANNPFTTESGWVGGAMYGAGSQGGGQGPTTNSWIPLNNQTPDSYYFGFGGGGIAVPMNIMNFQGPYAFGFNFDHGPQIGSSYTSIGVTDYQASDVNYCFPLWRVHNGSGLSTYSSLTTCPDGGNATLQANGTQTYNATQHLFVGKVIPAASTASAAGFNLALGVQPDSGHIVTGDCWNAPFNIGCYQNGTIYSMVTQNPSFNSGGFGGIGLGLQSNLVDNSATMVGGTWPTSSATLTITGGQTDHTLTGTTAVELAWSGASSFTQYHNSGTTLTLNATYTMTVWARGAVGGEVVECGLDHQGIVLGNVSPLTTTAQKYTATFTASVSGFLSQTFFCDNITTPTETVFIDSAQVILGTATTPYLPTTAAVSTPTLVANMGGAPVENAASYNGVILSTAGPNTQYLDKTGAYSTPLLSGTTGTVTGTALTATCDSGTATVTGAVVGQPVAVSSTTGADVGGAFDLRASVTATNTVTVYVCGTGTPASLAYNVMVMQ